MTQQEKVSKALYKYFFPDKCWHKWDKAITTWCVRCRLHSGPNPNLFSEVWFFKLLSYSEVKKWWDDFLCMHDIYFLINYKTYPNKLYDFLTERGEIKDE